MIGKKFLLSLILSGYTREEVNLYNKRIGFPEITIILYDELKYDIFNSLDNHKPLGKKNLFEEVEPRRIEEKALFCNNFKYDDYKERITEEFIKKNDCYELFYFINDKTKLAENILSALDNIFKFLICDYLFLEFVFSFLIKGCGCGFIRNLLQKREMNVSELEIELIKKYFFDIQLSTRNDILVFIKELNKVGTVPVVGMKYALENDSIPLLYHFKLIRVDETEACELLINSIYLETLKKRDTDNFGERGDYFKNASLAIETLAKTRKEIEGGNKDENLYEMLKSISVDVSAANSTEQPGILNYNQKSGIPEIPEHLAEEVKGLKLPEPTRDKNK